jgi:cyclopropane-fatty-acyl-phospholipid synthase
LKDLKHRFKEAVRRNFDESVEAYERFEEKHHLFQDLAQRMADLAAPNVPRKILDVGCGTGISTLALHQAFPGPPALFGLDISDSMLARAREKCRDHSGIYYLNGDAEHLERLFRDTFDAVFYTASLFLIPNYRNSIAQAIRLLVPKGILGISFYEGLFDAKRRDAMARAVPGVPYRYGALEFGEMKSFLDGLPDLKSTVVDYFFEITPEFLQEYLSIPAQSAGLFPRVTSPVARKERVAEVCRKLTEGGKPLFMGWKIVVCRKR